MLRDIFGRLIKRDPFGNKIPQKVLKKAVLEENVRKGKAAENFYRTRVSLQGVEVKRTGRGHDYKITQKDIFGNILYEGHREIKSSKTAPVSKLQSKMKKKLKNYKVIREDPPLY